jgi:hypothetical protein
LEQAYSTARAALRNEGSDARLLSLRQETGWKPIHSHRAGFIC